MPAYDYICIDCGTQREISHPMKESDGYECNECRGPMRKILGVSMVSIGAHNETRNGRKVHIPARNWR